MPRVPQFSRLADARGSAWMRDIEASRANVSVKGWRAVEAQHVVSTLRLTDSNPEKQDLLERILEESKPPLPPEAVGLHYLLATPFRYPPSVYGSRFRGTLDPGVLYSALQRRTACAEMGYWRWRFVSDSDGLAEIAASPQTLFQSGAAGSRSTCSSLPLAGIPRSGRTRTAIPQLRRLAVWLGKQISL